MKENFKARCNAQKFNIHTKQIDPIRKSDILFIGYWYANGKIYYGHPLFIFFLSAFNRLPWM
jgi:hypothetical protein